MQTPTPMTKFISHKHGFVGYFAAAFIALGFCSLVSLAVPPIGLSLFFFWTLPSLIHARINIVGQGRYMPLPWEDQFAAVILAFILQIPLWLTAGFFGFVLGALVYDLLARTVVADSYFIVWMGTTLIIYLGLFVTLILMVTIGPYRNDPRSKRISIRDAKPIYHPF